MKKPLLWVLILVMSILLVAVFSSSGCRPAVSEREAATQNELKNIATALEIFKADLEAYPAAATWKTDLEGGNYMTPVPVNDDWGNPYTYSQPGISADLAGYSIYSWGPDEADNAGVGDDITIIDGQLQ